MPSSSVLPLHLVDQALLCVPGLLGHLLALVGQKFHDPLGHPLEREIRIHLPTETCERKQTDIITITAQNENSKYTEPNQCFTHTFFFLNSFNKLTNKQVEYKLYLRSWQSISTRESSVTRRSLKNKINDQFPHHIFFSKRRAPILLRIKLNTNWKRFYLAIQSKLFLQCAQKTG